MLIGIAGWIILGVLISFIVSKFVDLRGDDPRLGYSVGAIAALIGGWLYSLIGGVVIVPFNVESLFFAGVGAVVALLIWHNWRRISAPKGMPAPTVRSSY
jgi:uncharacterized membrane protein YeaQ/YmgE (transglycosylase-associated protein family)